MSFNQPHPEDRKNSNDGPDWNDMFGKLTLGVLGGLAIGAGVLAVAKALEDDSHKESQKEYDGVLIAVDATSTTGGGILVIPQIKTVYYYSADLTKRFTFMNESGKFEMVNAFIALEIFADHIAPYTGAGMKALTDSNFSSETSYTNKKNAGYKVLQNKIIKRLKDFPFCGEWKQVSGDPQIKIADDLSRDKFLAAQETMTQKCPGYLQKQLEADNAVYKVSQIVREIARDYPELGELLK